MCNHRFKFLRQSMIFYKKRFIEIDVYQCINCQKLQIIDRDESKIISLNGAMGEEVDFDKDKQ